MKGDVETGRLGDWHADETGSPKHGWWRIFLLKIIKSKSS